MFAFGSAPLFGFIGGLGFMEMAVVGMIAVLLFGKNLPEVARKIGGSYQQFRKGLAEFQSSVDISGDIDRAGRRTPARPRHDEYDDYEEVAAPKFVPPPAEPAAARDEESNAVS